MRYNGEHSYLFVNGVEIVKFKVKDSEIRSLLLYLGNVSKDFSVDKMKKTELDRYVYGFNADYDAILIDHKLDIHKYLMIEIN